MTQAFDDYAASRPKPRLPARQKRGPIELLIIDMQAHDRKGNIDYEEREACMAVYLAGSAADDPEPLSDRVEHIETRIATLAAQVARLTGAA